MASGTASRRSSPIGLPQDSQTPYDPWRAGGLAFMLAYALSGHSGGMHFGAGVGFLTAVSAELIAPGGTSGWWRAGSPPPRAVLAF